MTGRFKLAFAHAEYGGVSQAVFHDLDGYQCRLRGCDSESLTLGLVGPRDFGTMHLDRERSREIALALLGFAVSGELGDKGKAALQNLRAACERVELTDVILQSNHQYAQSFANMTVQLQGSLDAGVKLERELVAARDRIADIEQERDDAILQRDEARFIADKKHEIIEKLQAAGTELHRKIEELETQLEEANEKASMLARRPPER